MLRESQELLPAEKLKLDKCSGRLSGFGNIGNTNRNGARASHWVKDYVAKLKVCQPDITLMGLGCFEVEKMKPEVQAHLARQAAVLGLKVQSPYSVIVRLPRLE